MVRPVRVPTSATEKHSPCERRARVRSSARGAVRPTGVPHAQHQHDEKDNHGGHQLVAVFLQAPVDLLFGSLARIPVFFLP